MSFNPLNYYYNGSGTSDSQMSIYIEQTNTRYLDENEDSSAYVRIDNKSLLEDYILAWRTKYDRDYLTADSYIREGANTPDEGNLVYDLASYGGYTIVTVASEVPADDWYDFYVDFNWEDYSTNYFWNELDGNYSEGGGYSDWQAGFLAKYEFSDIILSSGMY